MTPLTTALWAVVGAMAIGTAALWANPRRTLNRYLAAAALLLAGWFLCLNGLKARPGWDAALRLVWMGLGCSSLVLWLIRDVILHPEGELKARMRRATFWWLLPVGMSVATFTPWFLETRDATGQVSYGRFHYVLLFCGLAANSLLAITSVRQMKRELGAPRLDLQLLALGGVSSAWAAHVFIGLAGGATHPAWDPFIPLAVVALFGGTVWSLVTARFLDARHVLIIGCEKAVLVAGVAIFVWGIQQITLQFVPEWLSWGIAIALGLWFAGEVRPWLQEVSQRKASAEGLRRAAMEIARKEMRPEAMEHAFSQLVREWGHCERAVILMASHGRLTGSGLEWSMEQPEMKLLHSLRWVTPERLQRERPRADGEALAKIMKDEGFGAIVASAGPSISFALAIGVPCHHRPFIFPEIGQLLGLESIIESALSRAHYLMKAQHAEQLSTVGLLGASIAHEIRNPLVSIKTFVQLLPQHYQEAAFREKFFRLIGDEVGRIDRLTEQLLDLSAPRVFSAQQISLHELLSGCVDLIAAKADDKGVGIFTQFQAQTDVVYTDPNALKQVVLNLTFNAIQALEQQPGERWVRIETAQTPSGLELTVSDNGPGIAPEVRSRLFQPFQSTKSSGFGLGLAICKDILTNLHASITADPPESRGGATFRIILPCQPPTS